MQYGMAEPKRGCWHPCFQHWYTIGLRPARNASRHSGGHYHFGKFLCIFGLSLHQKSSGFHLTVFKCPYFSCIIIVQSVKRICQLKSTSLHSPPIVGPTWLHHCIISKMFDTCFWCLYGTKCPNKLLKWSWIILPVYFYSSRKPWVYKRLGAF